MGDSLLVKGISELLSQDVVDNSQDITQLEREYLGDQPERTADSVEQLKKRLAATASALGVDMPNLTPMGSTPNGTPLGATPTPVPIRTSFAPSFTQSAAHQSPFPSAPPEIMAPRISSQYTPPSYDSTTEEETQRNRIDSVMSSLTMENPGMSFAAEKARDEKLQLLAEIDDLKDQLIASNCNIEGIHVVDEQSRYEDVLTVRNILRFKDDRIKYAAMSSEFIMFLAYGVEHLFNGEREWFGYKLDMTGWSDHVQVKLRRMRSDLSNVTANLFQDYNIPSGARIALELLPSAVMYSRTKRQNQTYLDPNDDAAFAAATAKLRDMQSRFD